MKRLLLLLSLVPSLAFADKITATSWAVADGDGKVIESHNSQEQRSIASITKLMTAIVILDAHQDMTEKINGTSREDLIKLMIVQSNNKAADLLCENYPTGKVGCIRMMNAKAEKLGLLNTHYVDASGLGIMNVSTAEELIKVVLEAGKYPVITQASNIYSGKYKIKKRILEYHNTNPLVKTRDFIVSKTGYIRASGGCIVMMLNTEIGQRVVVLLNSRNVHTRIPEAYKLAQVY